MGCPTLTPLGWEAIPSPITDRAWSLRNTVVVSTTLRRYQRAGHLHFITFSCYRRLPKLVAAATCIVFEESLEQIRRSYGFGVLGYVVMPEHVHLLVSEPERSQLSTAIQAMKQSVARRLALRHKEPFWQARYYDFNVWSNQKRIEKLRYIHRNPVARGIAAKPEDWNWSSYRHYLTGVEGTVEIESEWTAARREQMGTPHKVKPGPRHCFPP
jgi:putative transposase